MSEEDLDVLGVRIHGHRKKMLLFSQRLAKEEGFV